MQTSLCGSRGHNVGHETPSRVPRRACKPAARCVQYISAQDNNTLHNNEYSYINEVYRDGDAVWVSRVQGLDLEAIDKPACCEGHGCRITLNLVECTSCGNAWCLSCLERLQTPTQVQNFMLISQIQHVLSIFLYHTVHRILTMS